MLELNLPEVVAPVSAACGVAVLNEIPWVDPLKNILWKGHAGDIALTMVHGEVVVENGRHAKVDEAAIMRTAATAAGKIWAVAAERGILPDQP